MKKQVKFVNIDDWNRPIFQQINTKLFYGSTEKLFPYDATESEVLEKVFDSDLCYFGDHFNCEPLGSLAGDIEIIRPEPEPDKDHRATYSPEDKTS